MMVMTPTSTKWTPVCCSGCGWTMWTGWQQTISCFEIQPYSPPPSVTAT